MRIRWIFVALLVMSSSVWADVDTLQKSILVCQTKSGEKEILVCLSQLLESSKKNPVEPNSANHPETLAEQFTEHWSLPLYPQEKAVPSQQSQNGQQEDPECYLSLCPYRPIYAIFRNSSAPNANPTPTPGHSVTSPVANLSTELKYQFSFKSMWARLARAKGEPDIVQLWAAYTQQSHWQLFDGAKSSPFRDTNYEPELYLNFPNPWKSPNNFWDPQMLGIGFVHQSNGQSDALSRSWNRTYLQAGFAKGQWSLLAKVWKRWDEDSRTDDNRDIENYVGRAELTGTYAFKPQVAKSPLLSLRLRHSMHRTASHGSALAEFSIPITQKDLRLYFQAFRGYGESLLDYDHQQTSLGVGLMYADW